MRCSSPLPVHASRYPPRLAGSWVFGIVMLAAMTTIAVAHLARTGELRGVPGRRGKPGHLQPAALRPRLQQGRLSYGDRRYLSKSGADVTWDSQAPLGQPFTVRVPVWAWRTGRNLIYGDGPDRHDHRRAVLRGDGGIAGVCPPGGPRARAVAAAARDDRADFRRSARKPATVSSRSAVNPPC